MHRLVVIMRGGCSFAIYSVSLYFYLFFNIIIAFILIHSIEVEDILSFINVEKKKQVCL